MASISQIKDWFKKGLKPTQAQFYAVFDSYRHKSEAIALNEVTGLTGVLASTPTTIQLSAGVQDAKDYAETVGVKRFTAISPAMTTDGTNCVWTIENIFNDEYAIPALYNAENDVVNILPNVTADNIVYTFASVIDLTAAAYRVCVIGIQQEIAPPEEGDGLPYTLPFTL